VGVRSALFSAAIINVAALNVFSLFNAIQFSVFILQKIRIKHTVIKSIEIQKTLSTVNIRTKLGTNGVIL